MVGYLVVYQLLSLAKRKGLSPVGISSCNMCADAVVHKDNA